MRNLIVVIMFTFISTLAFARGGEGMGRWSIYGFYGLGSVNPADLNTIAANDTTPAVGKVSTDTMYGGGLSYMFHPHFEIFGEFEAQEAKNQSTTTSPAGSSGWDLTTDIIWAGLNYYLVENNRVGLFIGAGAGYPTLLHGVLQLGPTNKTVDGQKSIDYLAQAGADVRVAGSLSIEIEGGYQLLTSTSLTNSSGTLNTAGAFTGGTAAQYNLSGFFGKAGLRLRF